ncbi:MAG: chemotaxis protein CheW [Anaerolineae bacterium]
MTNANDTDQLAILTFRVGQQYYALPIMNVLEVAAMMTLTQVPNAPAAMLGIANRHGRALSMLDLRIAFKMKIHTIDETTLFIVAQADERVVGLVVDDIYPVIYIAPENRQTIVGTSRYLTHAISTHQQLYQQIDLPALCDDHLAPVQP